MTGDRHILLAGLRGSGKSTLGRMLAERLGLPHVDLDDRTAVLLGKNTCAEALNELGEPAFREGEREALAEVLSQPACVVSLGGGTPTAPGAPEIIERANARVIYLRLSPETLASRLRASDLESRPSLTGKGVIEEIDALFSQRDPLYQQLGQTLEIQHEPPQRTLERIVALVGD